jgi:hypothetical protein
MADPGAVLLRVVFHTGAYTSHRFRTDSDRALPVNHRPNADSVAEEGHDWDTSAILRGYVGLSGELGYAHSDPSIAAQRWNVQCGRVKELVGKVERAPAKQECAPLHICDHYCSDNCERTPLPSSPLEVKGS